MPEITIKYKHPHELTELLSKLAQMYIVPQAICNVDTPYPPDYMQNKSSDDLNVQLKGGDNKKDNSAFIADSDNQLFTLEEAAEYLEVRVGDMPLVIANYLPSMGKLTTKEFMLSELRWIKANLKLSSTRFGEIKAQIRRT